MTGKPNNTSHMNFHPLTELLLKVPAIRGNRLDPPPQVYTVSGENRWEVEFPIIIRHPLSLETVQWFTWILNGLCLADPLPTCFFPYSSCPYLNGPPERTLTWIIDCPAAAMSPREVAGQLQFNLLKPLGRHRGWKGSEFPEEE